MEGVLANASCALAFQLVSAIPSSGRAVTGQAESSTLFVGIHGDHSITYHRLLSRGLHHDSNIGVIARTGIRFVVLLPGREAVAQRSDGELQGCLSNAVGETESHVACVLSSAAVAFGSGDFERERLVNA